MHIWLLAASIRLHQQLLLLGAKQVRYKRPTYLSFYLERALQPVAGGAPTAGKALTASTASVTHSVSDESVRFRVQSKDLSHLGAFNQSGTLQ